MRQKVEESGCRSDLSDKFFRSIRLSFGTFIMKYIIGIRFHKIISNLKIINFIIVEFTFDFRIISCIIVYINRNCSFILIFAESNTVDV